jgi:hypothetical protein
MTWCSGCGAQYEGPEHNCGHRDVSKDRLRELERAERRLADLEAAQKLAVKHYLVRRPEL